jgi:hypothetical protein
MTNSCMVLPDAGFHDGLRTLSRRYGALLIIDETHTISSGPGRLYPGAFAVARHLRRRQMRGGRHADRRLGHDARCCRPLLAANADRASGHSGMGTTLSANPMQFACLKATLAEVMTPEAYAHMEKGAERLSAGLRKAIDRHKAPWHVVRVGARVEFICAPGPLKNGAEAALAHQPGVEAAMHGAVQPWQPDRALPQHDADQPGHQKTADRPPDRQFRRHPDRTLFLRFPMSSSPSGSTVAEAEAFLAAHPEIEAFDIVLHDANGIGRGKIIRRHELLSIYKGRAAHADLDPRPRHLRRGRPRDRADLGSGRRRPARLADPRHAGAAARHQPAARRGVHVHV